MVDVVKELVMIPHDRRASGREENQMIMVVFLLVLEVTQVDIITLNLAYLFMLLYQRLRLVTLGVVLRVWFILHMVHLLDL